MVDRKRVKESEPDQDGQLEKEEESLDKNGNSKHDSIAET